MNINKPVISLSFALLLPAYVCFGSDFSLNQPGPRLCVVPTDLAKTIPLQPTWEQTPFGGHDLANGKNMSLVMILKR